MKKITPRMLKDVDPLTREGLISVGFCSAGKWKDVLQHGLDKAQGLDNSGVYAVVRPGGGRPRFRLDVQNVITPLSRICLKCRWVPDAEILYFGAAGVRSNRTLRNRLNGMIRHCKREFHRDRAHDPRGPHKGGEILWQVQGYTEFEILFYPTDGPPAPRDSEKALIARFRKRAGQRPFANGQD